MRFTGLVLALAIVVSMVGSLPAEAQGSPMPQAEQLSIESAVMKIPAGNPQPKGPWWTALISMTVVNKTNGPVYLVPEMTYLLQDQNGVTYAPHPTLVSNNMVESLANLDPRLHLFNPGLTVTFTFLVNLPFGITSLTLTSTDGSVNAPITLQDDIPTE